MNILNKNEISKTLIWGPYGITWIYFTLTSNNNKYDNQSNKKNGISIWNKFTEVFQKKQGRIWNPRSWKQAVSPIISSMPGELMPRELGSCLQERYSVVRASDMLGVQISKGNIIRELTYTIRF